MKIRVYDFNDLTALSKINLKKYKTHCQECLKKGINIKGNMGVFMYYFISGERYITLSLNNIYFDSNNSIQSEIIISELNDTYYKVEDLIYKCDFNDLLRISDYRLCFISTFSSDNKNVLLLLFDLYNNYKTICMRKYKISLNGNIIKNNL